MAICSRLVVALILGTLLWATSSAGAADNSTAACPAGSKRAVIGGKVKCLRAGQACSARYQAAYKKHGFTCVGGHLRKRKTTPPPTPEPPPTPTPPPAPPAPPAQPGHYHGTTSQLETFDLDVTSTGTAVTNIVTGQINEGCNPAGVTLSGGNFRIAGPVPLTSDGTFTIDGDYTSRVGDNPSTGHLTLIGHFSGATATGTLEDTTRFTDNGVAYSCGSGRQTWTATRTG